jgi:hypothetical protein
MQHTSYDVTLDIWIDPDIVDGYPDAQKESSFNIPSDENL